jgi:hypothetical protein
MNRILFSKQVVSLVFLLALSLPARAATVTLAWDANTESDLAGYNLFFSPTSFQQGGGWLSVAEARANSNYRVQPVAASQTEYTVLNLSPNTTYFFRLTAYDTSGNESGFNVVSAGNPQDEEAVSVSVGASANDAFIDSGYITPGKQDGVNDSLIFSAGTTEVKIFNVNGVVIFEKTGGSLSWDGKDSDGQVVPSGLYLAHLTDSGGKKTYQKIVIVK